MQPDKEKVRRTSVLRNYDYGDELSGHSDARLGFSSLEDWRDEMCALHYGAILICRDGTASLRVNFNEWNLYQGAVITLFPGDIVLLKSWSPQFRVEMMTFSPALLREASLQLEHTVYSALREDRCRQDTPVVTAIIDNMFALLRLYFSQPECMCVEQLVLLQLKAFFIGFHEYLQRNPQYRPDEVQSRRVRELFNQFMKLVERDYKVSRDVCHYADLMNVSSKYLTNIVRQVTPHTPKTIIDQYAVLQIKAQLQYGSKSVKEIAWEYHFSDVSFFCRYYKKHTGKTPQQQRRDSMEVSRKD